MDERLLTERLVSYDTASPDGLSAAGGFVKGWLESNGVSVSEHELDGRVSLRATVGDKSGPTVVFHGHLDVVPAHESQFVPRIEGDRLIGRGAYDMKGGLSSMLCAVRDCKGVSGACIELVVVPDEESEDIDNRSTDFLVKNGHVSGDFAITGEPTDLQVGVQAKGVLAMHLALTGTSAHGSTPWLGDNAVLKAFDAYRRIESMPFSTVSSEFYEKPSINLARISGGDTFNKVPDRCEMTVDVRYVPGQDPEEILAQVRQIEDLEVLQVFERGPAVVSRSNPFVVALRDAVKQGGTDCGLAVGRDGASDAHAFLDAGIPAVEFGPTGGGHHGPDEWVSIDSLAHYRQALVTFVKSLQVSA